MLDVDAALAQVLAQARRLPAEVTALTSAALGLILAADVVADLDSPPFTKSLMDGYAVRFADCQTLPVDLQIVHEVAAGDSASHCVRAGQAIAVFTGAPIPEGADTVVAVEQTELLGEGRVRIKPHPLTAGSHILPRGREMHTGELIVPAGTVITPAAFGLFATAGKTAVLAYPAPRLAILATGNELIEANRRPQPGQIRNSNGPMLIAQSVRAGGLPRYLGISRDEPTILRSLIQEGLNTAHILVLSGGVSVGKHDLVPATLRDLGVELHFHQVRLKPGKPLLFGSRGSTLVFGLPGNPVSSYLGFELFVRPALRMLAGHPEPGPVIVRRTLQEAVVANHDRPTYHPARCDPNGEVRLLPWFGSADLRGILQANGFAVLPAGPVDWQPGRLVEVMLTGEN